MYLAKVNGINMFINKFDTDENIINLDLLKEQFELDEGETGFYKLSLSEKKLFGTETINENYNRPPIGPIEKGLYCSFCSSIGPEDHSITCPFPEKDSLYLTIKGFTDYILKTENYEGDYDNFKNKFKSKTLTQEDINEILLIPDEIIIESGTFNINQYNDVFTNVPFFGIYKKRGPKKLATKTNTTQFLNNLMISYEKDEVKTSIRISKNGLINLINIPNVSSELNYIITELINRINNSNAVNMDTFNSVINKDYDKYTLIQEYSYIHSTSGQFKINLFETGSKQINFEELDNLISPFDEMGKVISGKYTTVDTTPLGDTIINLEGIKIIDWEFSLGKLTRNQVMSKEYIKFITNPAPGIKLTAIINKFGVVMMTLSRCSPKQIRRGLCDQGMSLIDPEMFNNIVTIFNKIFDENKQILVKKSLDETSTVTSNFNTVTGYAPSGKICRLTRTRDSGTGNYKEGMRPEPYSWKGKCPDPNYQYLKPEGVQDSNGLWFPCCETKTKESIKMMREYLLKGFPKNQNQAEMYNITQEEDLGSGILIPDSNIAGATAMVKIDGVYQEVTVLKKLSKKSNEYKVRTINGDKIVKGTDFKRDSRVFPGLNSFTREKLLNCIFTNLRKNNNVINSKGEVIKNLITELNEKPNENNKSIFLSLIKPITVLPFTYYSINNFEEKSFTVRRCPKNAYNFYLVLSEQGNFYIDNNLNSIESNISNVFDETIVLNGYLYFNEIENMYEYYIVDLLYLNEDITNNSFSERFKLLFDLQNLVFTNIIDEIFIYPDVYSNVIDGSYSIINSFTDSKLVYISDNDYIVWGEQDTTPDIITLQVLKKRNQIIEFGYDNNRFPDNLGLDFLNNYSFNKREIPEDLFVFDYFNIRVNRDFQENIVPNRKISLLDKTTKTLNYESTINTLLIKFNNIDSTFFSSNEEWYLSDKTLTFDGEKLK